MWNFYFPFVQCWLELFKDDGITELEEKPTWMRCLDTVQTEVLSLTPAIDGLPQRRHTIDVYRRLLSREQLIQIYPLFIPQLM